MGMNNMTYKKNSARALWHEALAQANDVSQKPSKPKYFFPNYIRDPHGTRYVGNFIIVRAILDLANVVPSKARAEGGSEIWGTSDRYLRKGEAPFTRQYPNVFIARANEEFKANKLPFSVPDDVFDRLFTNIGEIEEYCSTKSPSAPAAAATVYGLPKTPLFMKGPVPGNGENKTEAKSADLVVSRMAQFAAEDGTGIFVLEGDLGDGKSSAFASMLLRQHKKDEQFTLYLDCERFSSYVQIVQYLYDGLTPPEDKSSSSELSTIDKVDAIQGALQKKRLVIVLDNFEVLEDQTQTGELTIHDQGLFSILELLLSEAPLGTKLFIGESTNLGNNRSGTLAQLKALAGARFSQARMPAMSIRNGAVFLGHNFVDPDVAKEIYIDICDKYFTASEGIPSRMTLLFAAIFNVSQQLTGLIDQQAENRDGNGKAVAGDEIHRLILPAVKCILDRDFDGLVSFVVDSMPERELLAIKLIALSEDGLTEETLRTLLLRFNCDERSTAQILCAFNDKLRAPFIRETIGDGDHTGKEPVNLDVHRCVRHSIVKTWQNDEDQIAEFRKANREIARIALKKTVRNYDKLERLSQFRRALQFYAHELAGINPDNIELDELEAPRVKVHKQLQSKLERIKNEILDGCASEADRFTYAMYFYRLKIQGGEKFRLSRLFAADGVKVEALMRPFHIGYFYPPATSSLAGRPRSLPRQLPIGISERRERRQALEGRSIQMINRLGNELIWLVDKGMGTRLPNPPFSRRDGSEWLANIGAQIERIPEEKMCELAKSSVSRLLVFMEQAARECDKDRRNKLARVLDNWSLLLFDGLTIGASRIDDEAMYVSAITLGLGLSEALGDEESIMKFRILRLHWRIRKCQLAAGFGAASSLLGTAYERLKIEHERLQTFVDPEGVVELGIADRYQLAVRRYVKIAGRVADFQSFRGADVEAAKIYRQLAVSKYEQVALIQNEPALSEDFIFSQPLSGPFVGPSARNFVRFAVRATQIAACKGHENQRVCFDLGGINVIPDYHGLSTKEVGQLLFLARGNLGEQLELHRKLRQSDEAAAFALQESVMLRFEAMRHIFEKSFSSDGNQSTLVDKIEEKLNEAKIAARAGNVSVLTRCQLLSEWARFFWHLIIFEPHSDKSSVDLKRFRINGEMQSAYQLIHQALLRINRLIATADVRRLPMKKIDGLLLRAEIFGYCKKRLEISEKNEAQFHREGKVLAVSRDTAERILKDNDEGKFGRTIDVRADLDEVEALIVETDYRKRNVELGILRNRLPTAPCAYFVT